MPEAKMPAGSTVLHKKFASENEAFEELNKVLPTALSENLEYTHIIEALSESDAEKIAKTNKHWAQN